MSSFKSHNAVFKYALIACWITTAIIGYSGFFKNHDLLTVPLLNIPIAVQAVFLSALLMFTAVIVAVFTKPVTGKYLFFISLICYLIICISDVSRITPYMLVYFGLFGCFTFLKNDRHIFFTAIIFLISGIYIFSGLHKFNSGFIDHIAPRFYFHSLPISYNSSIGYSIIITEVALGILLLFKSTRKLAATLLILMHSIIIWKVSPWKFGWNYIIIPWNIVMIFAHIYIIRQCATARFKIGSGRSVFIGLSIWFWIIPCCSQFMKIPENISQQLYSGKSITGYISFSKKETSFSSIDLTPDKEYMLIYIHELSMEERGIAFNPEIQYYESVYSRLRKNYSSTNKLHLGKLSEIKKNLP